MDPTRQELLAAHLRYGAATEPLRDRAYAQLVTKVLFLAGRGNGLCLPEIRQGTADLAAGTAPSTDDVETALQFLLAKGLTEERKQSFALKIESWHRLMGQLEDRRRRIESIFERHFPRDVTATQFKDWFEAACIAFFTHYGDRWVGMVVRDAELLPDLRTDLDRLILPTIREHGLEERSTELVEGFRRFLRSREQLLSRQGARVV